MTDANNRKVADHFFFHVFLEQMMKKKEEGKKRGYKNVRCLDL
jgi:hypothetical protein